MKLGGLILAGGASSRMGSDKALQLWNGERAIDLAWGLARLLGAAEVLVSGGDYDLPFVPDPAGPHGPAAGVIVGCAALGQRGCHRVLVVAVDAPSTLAEDLAPLLSAPSPGACYFGLPLPMVIEIARLPAEATSHWPLRRLVEAAGLHVLSAPRGAQERLRGANTPAELAALQGETPKP
ncbi:MAG: molybdopterin-guanine dinucleotide biosynthesis protein [Caulobacteraceae bacterium]|nr:molybdopterin-guanine dinucleotide biosynthesis protein [Caulobacteraceae bacterium]